MTALTETDPYWLPGGWRRRPVPLALPLKPDTAACLTCTWQPWADPSKEAAQHTQQTRHPTVYRPPDPVARG